MRAPKARTEIRQDQIAQAALDLVLRHGWRKVSIAAVARKVGVVPSAIYRHYASKEEVLDAVLDLVAQRLLENVEAVRRETDNALHRLHRLLVRHVQLVRGEIPIPRVVFSEEAFAGSRSRRQRVYQLYSAYLEGIAEIVRQGQKQKHIRRNLEPGSLAVMFLGLVQPAAILWVMSAGEFDIERQAETAWQVFRQAIRNDQ